MPLIVKGLQTERKFNPVPAGSHIGRCVTVVNLGLQESSYNGELKFKEQVYIAFEIPGERVKWTKDDAEQEGAALIGSTFTKSIHPKSNLGRLLKSWRGKEFTKEEALAFDLFAIIDQPVQLSVIHVEKNGTTYANIGTAMAIPRGVVVPDRETPLLMFDPSDSERMHALDRMPNWMKEKCAIGHKMDAQIQPPKSNGLEQTGRVAIEKIQPVPATAIDNDDYDDLPF